MALPTTPKTNFATGDLLLASEMNEIGTNLLTIFNELENVEYGKTTGVSSTSSTTPVLLSADVSVTIDLPSTASGTILIGYAVPGLSANSGEGRVYIRVNTTNNTVAQVTGNSTKLVLAAGWLVVTGLTAGASHTVSIYWDTSANTIFSYANTQIVVLER